MSVKVVSFKEYAALISGILLEDAESSDEEGADHASNVGHLVGEFLRAVLGSANGREYLIGGKVVLDHIIVILQYSYYWQ